MLTFVRERKQCEKAIGEAMAAHTIVLTDFEEQVLENWMSLEDEGNYPHGLTKDEYLRRLICKDLGVSAFSWHIVTSSQTNVEPIHIR